MIERPATAVQSTFERAKKAGPSGSGFKSALSSLRIFMARFRNCDGKLQLSPLYCRNAAMGAVGFEPTKAQGHQIYSLTRLTTSVHARSTFQGGKY